MRVEEEAKPACDRSAQKENGMLSSRLYDDAVERSIILLPMRTGVVC